MILWTKTDDTTVANTVAETTMLDTGLGSKLLNPNFFLIGKVLKFMLRGYYTTILTPTLRFKFKLNPGGVIDTGAVSLTTVPAVKAWMFSGFLTCRTTGGTGSIVIHGLANWSTATIDTLGWDNSTGAVTLDTTAEQTMDITAQWGTANAVNTLTANEGYIEVLDS
jgi:hypothetical protein